MLQMIKLRLQGIGKRLGVDELVKVAHAFFCKVEEGGSLN